MELRQIRYFAAVARHRHFTRAAEELGLAQPALSQQVRSLEGELGVMLIDRSGRRVRLTDAGEGFLVWAERILADVAGAETEMAEFAGLSRGRVTVGSTPVQTLGRVDLSGLLAAFHARYPGVEIALREETTPTMIEELQLGRIDVALGALMGDSLPPGIVAEPLFAEELVAIVATTHPLADRSAVPLAELAKERFVLAKPGSPIRRTLEEAAATAGASIRVSFETSEQTLVRAIVSRGLAVAVVPRSLAEEPGLPVAILQLQGLPHQRTVALLWADRPHTAAAQRFLTLALRWVSGDG
jgi:LysR family transcriptional activator of glutamate synthase operon